MSEGKLRWQGRIGSLKWLGFIGGVLALLMVIVGWAMLDEANTNADGPRQVTISDLVDNKIKSSTYVSVGGTAEYQLSYTQEEDGKVTRTYYYLVDYNSRDMIVVEHSSPNTYGKPNSEKVRLTGMVRLTSGDLKELIEADQAGDIKEADMRTISTLYLDEGAEPPSAGGSTIFLILSLIMLGLCIIPFFFPSRVYRPVPVDPNAQPLTDAPMIKATGKFLRLKKRDPIEIGRGAQTFNEGVANLIPQGSGQLMVYIHHIVTTKRYGITISRHESDWGVFLTSQNVAAIEPGKIYGWKDRWVVRFDYNNDKGKLETLYVTLENPQTQARLVQSLRAFGFTVSFPAEPLV